MSRLLRFIKNASLKTVKQMFRVFSKDFFFSKTEFKVNSFYTEIVMPMTRCDGSDGTAEDSGLRGPGFIQTPCSPTAVERTGS